MIILDNPFSKFLWKFVCLYLVRFFKNRIELKSWDELMVSLELAVRIYVIFRHCISMRMRVMSKIFELSVSSWINNVYQLKFIYTHGL
jgi:sRNA-binding regulator protein Hfq